jgi:circadian clock protein KaiB
MAKKLTGVRTGKEQTKEKSGKTSESNPEKYFLELYVTGMTPRSLVAIENVKNVCREYLGNRCKLEIIDIYRQPAMAKAEQIIASPTLIKKLPLPVRRLIGDMSVIDRVLSGLDLRL